MENDKLKKYRFPATFDAELRLFGLPVDELILLTAPPIIAFFGFNALVTGLVIGLAFWLGIRKLKQGRGSNWLYSWLYWHLPAFVFRLFYKKLPPSSNRKWI